MNQALLLAGQIVFFAVALVALLLPVGAIVSNKRASGQTKLAWACLCALGLVAGLAIWYLRMRYITSMGLPPKIQAQQPGGFIFVIILPWSVYLCFRHQTSDFPKISNLVLLFAVTACAIVGFLSITAPPEKAISNPSQYPNAVYLATGIAQVSSPWLQVLVLLVAFAIWLCAIAAFAVWINKNAIPAFGAWIFKTKERAQIVHAGIWLVVIGLVAFSGVVAALIFGEVGQTTGLGRDLPFLAYWVMLLFLSAVPSCYILKRNGLLK